MSRSFLYFGLFPLLALIGIPALAQVADPSGDTSSGCVDIVRGDVRADRTTLTATLEVGADFCAYAHYFFHIDGDMDGESDIALQTKFDRGGNASTTGAPGVAAEIDRADHRITWRVPLAEIEPADDPAPQDISVWFRTLVNTAKDRLPDNSTDALPFHFGATAAALVGPQGGTISITDPTSDLAGAVLSIPLGALDRVETMSLGEAPHAPAFAPGVYGYSPISIEPSGLRLSLPATLTLPYRSDQLDAATTLGEDTLSIFHFDDNVGAWVGVPSEPADIVHGLVSSRAILGFSYYILKDDQLTTLCAPDLSNPQPARQYLPLVLVHGWQGFCGWGSGDTFGQLGHFLCDEKIDVFEMLYNTSNAIETSAERLVRAIDKATVTTNAGAVNLVAHSMGGLMSRYAIERLREDRIYRLLTAATPHLGVNLGSCYDLGLSCRSVNEMSACSDFLEDFFAGLNPGIRAPKRPLDLLACTGDYKFYAAGTDGLGIGQSCLGLDWPGACSCNAGPAEIFASSDLGEDIFRQTVDGVCGLNGDGPCCHTTVPCPIPGGGIVDIESEQHGMWEPIRSLAAGARWFPDPGFRSPTGPWHYQALDLSALYNETNDRLDDGVRGLFDYYGVPLISVLDIPFRVKTCGVNTVSSTVAGEESFRFNLKSGRTVHRVLVLGVGTYLADYLGHEKLWCANPDHFWWEIHYTDGSADKVFPTDVVLRRQEWSDILRSEGAVASFPASPTGYVHLYELVPDAGKPIDYLVMKDNFNPADYTVLAITLEY